MQDDLLLHVDTDAASLATALRNAKNYIAALAARDYTIALVVNGDAVELLRDATCAFGGDLAQLCAGRLRLYVCNNSLKAHGIAPEELVPQALVVPAGIVQLVALQRQGYAYVKP